MRLSLAAFIFFVIISLLSAYQIELNEISLRGSRNGYVSAFEQAPIDENSSFTPSKGYEFCLFPTL